MKLAYAPFMINDKVYVDYVPADSPDWNVGPGYPNTGTVVFKRDDELSLMHVHRLGEGSPEIDFDAARLVAREALQQA